MVMALEGVRILDLSRLLPGPYCSMLLADLGAEVVKIEEPGRGDYFRWMGPTVGGDEGYGFLMLNRNKKSVALNLKSKEGKEIFLRLVNGADVVLESFRPGVMDRLGLSYEALRQINPRIIMCSISGYGQDGPYRNLPGHDVNYLAYAGVLGLLRSPGARPEAPIVRIADFETGERAALAILTALVGRERTGKGQHIDISMIDGSISWLLLAAADFFATGKAPRPEDVISRGDRKLAGREIGYGVYETSDGKYVSIAAAEEKFWRNLCSLAGRGDLLEQSSTGEEGWEQMDEQLRQIFAGRTRDEWTALLQDKDVCYAPVLEVDEVFQDPQVVHRQMVIEVEDPIGGRLKQIGTPIKLSDTPPRVRCPAPRLGEHTDEILAGLGYSDAELKSLHDSGVI